LRYKTQNQIIRFDFERSRFEIKCNTGKRHAVLSKSTFSTNQLAQEFKNEAFKIVFATLDFL